MNKLILFSLVCLPLKHLALTSSFGFRIHPVTGQYKFHAGIDLRARQDTVYAILPGTVQTGYDDFLGLYIRLDHSDSLESSYGHLSRIFVRAGDTVAADEPIAITGATGRVTGEHLHFSVYFKQQPIDPLKFLYQIIIKQKHHEYKQF